MFRRPRPQPAPPAAPDPQNSGVSAPASGLDATRVLSELLSRPTHAGVLEGALGHATALLGGDLRGYAVVRRGQDSVAAVSGYPGSLVGTPLSGPWATMRARVLADGSRELYQLNPPEVHALLDGAGMRDVKLSLVLPLSDRGRQLGALVLDRFGAGGFDPAAQEAAGRWAGAVAPLLRLLDSREDWRQTARQVTGALVEAVESRDFDALGHAAAVAQASVRLGRAVGLAERELEELWYAATLHDVGKIHGESGHPQVGANFLHGVAHLTEAQKAIRHHHERWDGQGEPDRLEGEDIPLYARILAVANAYVRLGDLERLRGQAGKGLDARLVGLMERVVLEAPPQ